MMVKANLRKHIRDYPILRAFGKTIGIDSVVFAEQICKRFSELKPDRSVNLLFYDHEYFLDKYTRLVSMDEFRIPQLGEWVEVNSNNKKYMYYWNIIPPEIPCHIYKLIICDNFGYILDENFKLE